METPSSTFRRAWLVAAVGATVVLLAAASQQSQNATMLGRWSREYSLVLALLAGVSLALWLGCLKPVQRRIWSARGPLLVLTGSLTLALVAGEVLLRILDPMGLNYHGEIARYIELRQDDAVLEYVQPKDVEVELDGVQVHFNSSRLRGPALSPAAAEGTRRLLVLGDSVAFGWGVEEAAIFPTRLAAGLAEATGEPWEPINAGVCSYNTEQELLYLKHHGLALEPDLVVLVYVDNDVVTYGERWKSAEASKPPLRRRIKRALQQSRLVQTVSHVIKRGGGVELEGVERALGPDDEGWKRNMQALRELTAVCAENKLPLAIYHFRWRPSAWSDALLAEARSFAAPIEIVDTTPWFADIPLPSLVNSATDSHPNAQAHGLTAARMQQDLEQRALLEVLD